MHNGFAYNHEDPPYDGAPQVGRHQPSETYVQNRPSDRGIQRIDYPKASEDHARFVQK
jgi:hypothetical protein